MQIIAKIAAHYAATLGRVYSALPPKSQDTPITAASLREALKEERKCSSTIH